MISNNNQNQIKTTINNKSTTNNKISNDLTGELTVSASAFFKVPGLEGSVELLYPEEGVTQVTISAVSLGGEGLNLTIPSTYTPSDSSTTYTITAIGGDAFEGCTNLESINIPSSLKSIQSQTFTYCASLESVTFESGSQLESIWYGAFWQCTSLWSISIPENVSSIGEIAFAECTSLKSVTFEGNSQLEMLLKAVLG